MIRRGKFREIVYKAIKTNILSQLDPNRASLLYTHILASRKRRTRSLIICSRTTYSLNTHSLKMHIRSGHPQTHTYTITNPYENVDWDTTVSIRQIYMHTHKF